MKQRGVGVQVWVFAMVIACLLVVAPGPAGSAVPGDLPHTTGTIVVDGVMDDAEWAGALRIDVDVETRPGENTPPPVKTTAYLIENGHSLYIAFDAEDPEPDKIRAYLRDRDSAWNDDFVGIVIDTYGDERYAYEFFANPLGVQMDLTNDDVNRNEDDSWDAIWDSAGKISDRGFVVEMAIPFSQLRFPRLAGKQTWGIDVLRFYPRDHRYRLSNNPQDRSRNCYLCQLGKIRGLDGAEPSRDLEVVPTLTALQARATDDPGIEPLSSGSVDTELGVNVRWGVTPDTTLNLAVNPDFSQVEADAAQLDINNQFALFFPEKRPFFLEGADYFNTPFNAVFTRSVADPSIGAKVTGKRGGHTYGFFAAEDDVTNLIFPGPFGSDSESLEQKNTVLVGRYARSFGDAASVGALVTSRNGDDYDNTLAGLDFNWKINDQHRLQVQHLRTSTEYPDAVAAEYEQPSGRFDGSGTFVIYDYDSRDWFAYLRHRHRSEGFRADAGFIPQVNTNTQVVGLGRVWHGKDDTWWSRMHVNGDWDITHDDDGRLLEREVELEFRINGPLQSALGVGVENQDLLYDDVMFATTRLWFLAEFQPRGGLLLGTWSRFGKQVDFDNTRLGDERRSELWLRWNINRNWLLRYDATFVSLDTRAGPSIFDAAVHDLRLTWHFNVRSFLRITTQWQDVERNQDVYVDAVDSRERDVGRQLLYSYKINPQTVFFLGYSDALLEDDSLSRLTTTDRTWFMKIGYAWTPDL